jgi:hypothetical protein
MPDSVLMPAPLKTRMRRLSRNNSVSAVMEEASGGRWSLS